MRKRLLALGLITPLFAFATGCDDSGMAKIPDNAKKVDTTKDAVVAPPAPKQAEKQATQGTTFGAD